MNTKSQQCTISICIYIDGGLEWGDHMRYIVKRFLIICNSYDKKIFIRRKKNWNNYTTVLLIFILRITQYYEDQHINTDCTNLNYYRRNQSEIYAICWIQFNASTTSLFKQLGITKLMDIYNIQLCKLIYSYSNVTLFTPLQTIFTNNSLACTKSSNTSFPGSSYHS